MKTLFNPPDYFNEDYYERGAETGKSLYSHYRWIPELTIPMCHHIAKYMNLDDNEKVLDFGCAKGYTVYALRLLGIKAFGVDVSEYAISQAPKEVSKFLGVIKPFEEIGKCTKGTGYDWVLCKDILEHIEYKNIERQLEILNRGCTRIFIIVPLGENGKYVIPSYELDKSHFIREDINWWTKKVEDSGYTILESTHDLGPFKKNWQFEPKGNALIMGVRKGNI